MSCATGAVVRPPGRGGGRELRDGRDAPPAIEEEVVKMLPPAYMLPVHVGRPSCATGAVPPRAVGEGEVKVLLRGYIVPEYDAKEGTCKSASIVCL